MFFQLGDCFWVKTGPLEPIEHLWVLVTKPNPLNASAICVNVTSARSGSDRTTVLQPGDHTAVKHESVIYYKAAKLVDLTKLAGWIQAKLARQTSSFYDPLLTMIQDGILTSKFTPRKLQNAFRAEKAAGRV